MEMTIWDIARMRAIAAMDQLMAEHDKHLGELLMLGKTDCPSCQLGWTKRG